ncbi:MAG: tetratricopeptide repeat protein [Pseudomonadota bacterium]
MADDTRLDAAIEAHEAGRLQEAEAGFRAVLSASPDNADVMQRLGVARAQQGDLDEAKQWLERAVDTDAGHYAALDNLGNLRQLLKDYAGAAECYRKATALAPDAPEAHYNLGVALAKHEDVPGAEAAYRHTVELAPDHYNARYNLAHLLLRNSNNEAAVAVLDEALSRWSEDARLLLLKSDAHRNLKQWQQAADVLQAAIDRDPSRAHLSHMVDAYRGEVPERPPDAFVSDLFDGFAADYDARLLLNLDYQVPMTLAWLLTDTVGEDVCFDRLLDLGCGSGLSGIEFHDYADAMVGVDLSPKMLEKARARDIYVELSDLAIDAYLDCDGPSFDAFVAADVFVYVGSLERVFEGVAARAEAGATFLFSVEATDSDSLELRQTGRYAHPQSYIRQLAAANGFTVARHVSKPLRLDFGEPVMGDYYLLVAG